MSNVNNASSVYPIPVFLMFWIHFPHAAYLEIEAEFEGILLRLKLL